MSWNQPISISRKACSEKRKRSPRRSHRSNTPSWLPDCTLHGALMEATKVPGVCRSGYSFWLWHTPLVPLQVRITSLRCSSNPVGYVRCAACTSVFEPA